MRRTTVMLEPFQAKGEKNLKELEPGKDRGNVQKKNLWEKKHKFKTKKKYEK